MMLPVYPNGIARPTAIITRAPVTVRPPVTPTAPAPVYALPQPKIPTLNPSPVSAPAPAPILSPGPAPVAPISVLSGAPIQTSIFQSTHTPSTLATQIDTEYQGPTDSALPGALTVYNPAIPAGTHIITPTGGGTFFGIDQNSFWILLLLAIAVIILVTL